MTPSPPWQRHTEARASPPWATAAACALVVAVALLGCETTSPAGAGTSATAGTGTAVQAHSRLIDAFNSCNEAGFVGAYAPLFTFATSNTKQPLTTREGLQRYLGVGCAGRPNPTAALVQQTVRVSGAITVLVGQYRFRVPLAGAAASAGAPQAAAAQAELLQNFTLVLERMGERWLVLAHHVSVAP